MTTYDNDFEPADQGAIAIIGMTGRFPDAATLDQFWHNLRSGRDSVRRISDEELRAAGVDEATLNDPSYVKATAMLDGFELFDAEFFGLSAREAEIMDPQQRLFLECAWEALEHAGYNPSGYQGAIGLYAGTSTSAYLFENILSNPQVVASMGMRQVVVVNDKDFLCGRTAYELDLRGPAVNVQTACSTSLVAVHLACQSILNGECDMALAGGVTVSNLRPTGYHYAEGGLNAREGHCRAFDADASGIITGNGAGIVVLKSLAAAVRDGDTVHAVIRGTAINNDGHGKVSFTAPSVDGQAAVISEALSVAGLTPDTIDYVEAHGTGTLVGDPVEVGALSQAYGDGARQYCALGSLKTNVGHLDAAAGIAGLIKTALALKHGEIPPSLHFERPNPHIDFDNSPFFVNTALRPWPQRDRPRRAGVSSFGIGGTNAHVVMEQAPPLAPSAPARAAQLLVVSGRTPAALDAACGNLAAHLERAPDAGLADIAYTLQQGRQHFRYRRSIACAAVAEAVQTLRLPQGAAPLTVAAATQGAPAVFLFPGGGTQYVGMGAELYAAEPVFRGVIDECAALLQPILGLDLRTYLYPEPEQQGAAAALMEQTAYGLPALFATEYAMACQLQAWGVRPAAMAGHSLGEYVAACVAGVFPLADALAVVAARGRLISGLPPANMVAVLAPAAQLQAYLGPDLWLACVNSRQSCTIGGTPDATQALARRLADDGIEFQLLEYWPASHTGLMEPILDAFRTVLAGLTLHAPRVPYVSNLSGDWITAEQATDPEYWVAHLRGTVHFADCLARLLDNPEHVYVEAGPGHTLCNLLKRDVAPGRQVASTTTIPRRDAGGNSLLSALHGLGQLWCAGVPADWAAMHEQHGARRRVPLPTYPFQRKRYWIEPGRATMGAAPIAGSGWQPGSDEDEDEAAVADATLARHARPALPTPYVPAQTPVQQSLCAIWETVLGVSPVGIEDDFFLMGGSSLLAIQLGCRIRATFAVEIPLRTLFRASTVAAQAEAIEAARGAGAVPLQAIPRREPGSPVRPSFAQQRLLFLEQLDHGASAAYHIAKAIRIRGPLCPQALRATLDRIVARHENLRTTFARDGAHAIQLIAPADCGFALGERDFSHLRGAERDSAVQRMGIDEACAPFDLESGPLVRGQLLRLAQDEHVLLLTQHHIISDGWSLGVLIREISTLYAAFARGEADPLPPLAIQYADYAAWQRDWLQGEALQAHQRFWHNHLAGAPVLLALPTDRPRPDVQSYVGAHYPFQLDAELSDRLRALAQRHGCTLFMTLLAGWAVLLARLSGQNDAVLGTPVANRQRAELEALTGFFVNTLALRVRLDENATVAGLLEQVRADTLAAYEHQDLPFDQVVELLRPVRSTSHGPLFQAMINVHNTPGDSRLAVDGLEFAPVDTPENSVQCDIVLSVEVGATVAGTLNYACALFDEASVARIAAQLSQVLQAMTADDGQRVLSLPLLDAAGRREMRQVGRAAPGAWPQSATVHGLFAAQAARRPGAVALAWGDTRVSYGELDAQANRIAHRLRALGVGPESRVAVCMERSPVMVAALLGVLKAGGAYVPLDPGAPAARQQQILADSAPLALLAQASQAGALPDSGIPVLYPDAPGALDAMPDTAPEGAGDPTSLAYVIYTSGSTGTPKGVMVEHRNIVQLAVDNSYAPLGEDDCVAHCANPAFDASTWEIWGALLCGARVAIVPQPVLLDAGQFGHCLRQQGVTALFLTVALLNQYAEALAGVLPQLTWLLFGGEKIDLGKINGVLRRAAPTHVVHCYGPTETTTFATAYRVPAAALERPVLPIGAPIANGHALILDAQMEAVPFGVVGEIYLGGAGVARGYLNRPEIDAERFVRGPDGERLYRTGDLARWLPDGQIEYVGRNDCQVKMRGFRIELGEIEARLLACEGVREAVVLAREDQPGDKRLVAYVAAQDGAVLSAGALRQALAAWLAGYMLPAAFVVVDHFPLTANGKIDRKALPAPDAAALDTSTYEAPLGRLEQAIADLWQELLGVPRVGRHAHFFELGGHSLVATQFVARLRDATAIDLPLVAVFQAPTVAALAEAALQQELLTHDSDMLHSMALDIDQLSDEEVERLLAHEYAAQ